jgi:hypothetical protein
MLVSNPHPTRDICPENEIMLEHSHACFLKILTMAVFVL